MPAAAGMLLLSDAAVERIPDRDRHHRGNSSHSHSQQEETGPETRVGLFRDRLSVSGIDLAYVAGRRYFTKFRPLVKQWSKVTGEDLAYMLYLLAIITADDIADQIIGADRSCPLSHGLY